MSYTPIGWQTGDTITADKLNKMDPGWGVESTQLFSESVTTEDTGDGFSVGTLEYSEFINADTINVLFDSVAYTCLRIDAEGDSVYGGFNDGPDFTTYPFFIYSGSGGDNSIITQTAGAHTVAVSEPTLISSDEFKSAVGSCIVVPLFSETSVGSGVFTCNMTFDEVNKACAEGRCFQALIDGNNAPLSRHDLTQDNFAFITVSGAGVKRTEVVFINDGSIRADITSYPAN